MEAYLKDEKGKTLIRYSAIVARLKEDDGADEKFLSDLANEIREAGMTCPDHGLLDDPILGIVVTAEGPRLCVACPWCSGETVAALWESQAPKG